MTKRKSRESFPATLWNFAQEPRTNFIGFANKAANRFRHMCCWFAVGGSQSSSEWSSGLLLRMQGGENWRIATMAKDDRDILELLKEELAFIEQGGYGRSVRTPWLPKSIFQDSLTCINYGFPYRAHPCNECHLLDFVSDELRSQEVPCHHIALNEAGETIEDLERQDNQVKLETDVKKWLRGKIAELETRPRPSFWQNVD